MGRRNWLEVCLCVCVFCLLRMFFVYLFRWILKNFFLLWSKCVQWNLVHFISVVNYYCDCNHVEDVYAYVVDCNCLYKRCVGCDHSFPFFLKRSFGASYSYLLYLFTCMWTCSVCAVLCACACVYVQCMVCARIVIHSVKNFIHSHDFVFYNLKSEKHSEARSDH